jgi:putative ABC transport system permease protein
MDGAALADALGLSGAFNDLVLRFSVGAKPLDIQAAVDRMLEPYGGIGSQLRAEQPSNRLLNQKLDQLRVMAKLIPSIFLAVSAFLLNLVLSRIVGAQREQIATLKALGYGTASIARHYLLFALVICSLGALGGVGLGALGTTGMVHIYGHYFNLPHVMVRLNPSAVVSGVGASLLAGTLGAFSAVRRTVRLSAAEAMQPEPPESFKPTFIERLKLDRFLGVAGRMVLRDMERHPYRLALSSLAVALATAILFIGGMMLDSLNRALWQEFNRVEGEDVTVTFDNPRPQSAVRELGHVPGVHHAEVQRVVFARLWAGFRKREVPIFGVPPHRTLRRFLDFRGEPLRLPQGGLALSRPLSTLLDLRVGDEVEVEVLEAGRRRFRVPVAGFVDDFAGLSGYMALGDLEAHLDEAPSASGALLALDRSRMDDVLRRLRQIPKVAGVSRPDLDGKQFAEQEADVFRNMQELLIVFAAIIAVGMVFNNARIALALRQRDLATLRILGFTRGEVAVVLLGEQAVQLVLGVAFGLPLGYFLGVSILAVIPPELFRIPAALTAVTVAKSAAVVLAAGALSALLVRRDADRLDLVSVLKARD